LLLSLVFHTKLLYHISQQLQVSFQGQKLLELKYSVGQKVWSCDQFEVEGPFIVTGAYWDDCGGYCKPPHPCYRITKDEFCHGEHTLFPDETSAQGDLADWRRFRDWARRELEWRKKNKGR
jgi:hypothetical protein